MVFALLVEWKVFDKVAIYCLLYMIIYMINYIITYIDSDKSKFSTSWAYT